MARPTNRPSANPLPLPDGKTVSTSLKLRGEIYRVVYPHPTIEKRYVEVSTGKRTEREAWPEAAKIVLAAYDTTAPVTAKNITWQQVLEQLPKAGGTKKLVLRQRTLDMYRDAVNALTRTVSTKGPADVTPEVARNFAVLYATTPYTRGKERTITRGKNKGTKSPRKYIRGAKTVSNAIHFLSCLWSRLQELHLATINPFENVPKPTVPKKIPTAPTEEDFANLFAWVDGKGWEMMSVFLRVKALAGCRTADLCQLKAYQFDPKAGTVAIDPDQDKTFRERLVPLPPELAARLTAIKGKTYLWENYTTSIREHSKDPRAATEFTPERLAMAVRRLFVQYAKQFPNRPRITPHDFRRRAITLTVKATGSVDAAANALGVTAATAKRHYLDSGKAFDSAELLKRMAGVLLPQNTAPEQPQKPPEQPK